MLSILRKELLSYFYSPLAWVVMSLFLVVQGYSFFLLIKLVSHPQGPHGAVMKLFFGGTVLFWLSVIFVASVITMRLVAEERRSNTIESLMTAPVTEARVVLGKYLAAVVFYALLWLPTLLYGVVLWMLSGRLDQVVQVHLRRARSAAALLAHPVGAPVTADQRLNGEHQQHRRCGRARGRDRRHGGRPPPPGPPDPFVPQPAPDLAPNGPVQVRRHRLTRVELGQGGDRRLRSLDDLRAVRIPHPIISSCPGPLSRISRSCRRPRKMVIFAAAVVQSIASPTSAAV